MKKPQWQSELEYLADCEADGKEWGVIDNGRVAAYLMREGYAIRLPQYRNIKAYQITGTGARAIGRGSLFPMYDVYEGYRENAWRGGYAALSYEEWYSIQPEAQPVTGTAQAAETPVSPRLNNALNVLTGENRQWVEVKPEQRIAEVFSLLDDAGVRDGNLMSITDRVKALIQERDDTAIERNTAIEEHKRVMMAMKQIQGILPRIVPGLWAAPVKRIRSIVEHTLNEALAEPIGE